MPRAVLILALACLTSHAAEARAQEPCAELRRSIQATYNFRPALLSEREREAKIAAMDAFWQKVKDRRAELLPCLRSALEEPRADAWFRFDGSNLLVSLDPSPAAKAAQVRHYTAANLDDVHLGVWVTTLAERGAEGFDVSEAGARWLAHPQARYFLPQHGAHEVGPLEGALYIFGSMDEAQATPALLKLVRQAGHPGREHALRLLMSQATPEALRALRGLGEADVPPPLRGALRDFLRGPELIEPRARPKTTREQFVRAFERFAAGDPRPFLQLVEEVPDGERDVVAVLRPEDVPLVRRVRRAMISRATPHAAAFYHDFTKIIMTLVLKSQPPGGAQRT